MKNMSKRLLAWLLALAMVLTSGNMNVFAASGTEETASSEAASVSTVSDDTDETMSIALASTSTLTAEEYVEQQFEAAFDSYSTTCEFDADYALTWDTVKTVFNELINTDYRYFYVDGSLAYTTTNGVVTSTTITYTTDSKETAAAMLAELETVITQVLSNVDSSWSDMEKALYIHDYITRNCEYDSATAACKSSSDENYNDYSFTAYGALVNGLAVCEGYSESFLALVREVGLDCELVTSSTLGHEWNLVKINGSWYQTDVTWDDPTSDMVGRSRHQYFMKSSSYFSSTDGGHSASDWTVTGSASTDDASTTTYDSYFWNDVDTGFEYVDGTWYGLVDDTIYSYTCNGSSFTQSASVLTISDVWYAVGSSSSYYPGVYAGFASYDELLYYSTATDVYSYDPSTGTSASVYSLSSTYAANGYIYALSIDLDGNITILLSASPNTTDWVDAYTVMQIDTSKTSIAECDITLSATSYTYDGSAKTPTVTVKDGSTTLTAGMDYTVTYSNNTNAGTATVIIVGTGNYTGTYTAEFTINKASQTITLTNTADNTTIAAGSALTKAYADKTEISVVTSGDGTINYSTSDTSVAAWTAWNSSTNIGTVQAMNTSGTATITLTAAATSNYNAVSVSFTITCTKKAQSITLSSSEMSLAYGGSSKSIGYSASGDPNNTITYASSNTSVATVDSAGKVTPVGAGTCTVTLTLPETTYYSAATASFTVTVAQAAHTLSASIASTSIKYGATTSITASSTTGTVSYSSSNSSVASVSSSGVVTGKGVGTATITVKVAGTTNYSEASKTFTVTVSKATQTVTISKTSLSVNMGSTVTISASTNGDGTLTYASSDASIATVSSTGKVTPKKVGTVKITVYAAAGTNYSKSSSKTVTVTIGLKAPTISSVKQSNTTTTISWGKVTGASGYYVYRSTSSSSAGTKIKTITSGSTVSYKDTASKTNGTTYYYRVYAYSGSTKSAASTAKSIKYMKGSISSLTNVASGVTVKWSKVSNATGYYIYRKAGSGSYSKVKTITSASTTSWTDTSVKSKNGTTYTYYVQPYNKTSTGAYTTSKTVRLTAVSISSVKNSSSKKMTVKWAKNSSATGYQIQYSTSSSFSSGNKTATVTGYKTVSKVISSLTKGKTYYVRIRAYKSISGTKYYSAWSSKKSVKISK